MAAKSMVLVEGCKIPVIKYPVITKTKKLIVTSHYFFPYSAFLLLIGLYIGFEVHIGGTLVCVHSNLNLASYAKMGIFIK